MADLTKVAAVLTKDGIEVACPRCSFRRIFRTDQGAMTKLTEHMLAKHRVRPIWRAPAEKEVKGE